MQALYKTNLSPIFASLGAHGPFVEWVDSAIVYGMFLSDLTLLSAVESELVTLTAIMCQGLKAPTLWHLRGLRRLGVSEGDVEAVQRAVEGLMVGVGGKVDGWARVRDVEAEV